MKKIITILMALTLLFSSIPATFAYSNTTSTSEYDMYLQLQTQTDEELLKKGMTVEEIEYLRNFDFNDIFAERAKLDDRTLQSMGYNHSQIKALRDIYGENNLKTFMSFVLRQPEKSGAEKLSMASTRGIFANLSISTNHAGGSDSYIKVTFDWEWSNLPAYFGGKDALGIVWKGTNFEGKPLNVALDESASYHKLYEENNVVSVPAVKHNWTVTDEYGGAKDEFYLGYRVEDMIGWYKSGDGVVKLERTGSNAIKEVSLKFAYGHTYVGISTGINISPVSYFIGFNWKTETMDENSARYTQTAKE